MSRPVNFVNGLRSLSGLRTLSPEASDFLYDASNEMERLRKALQQILDGSRNSEIGNTEFRVKAAQTAHGVLGDVGTPRDD